LPNFFIVGAVKCGTTSLYEHLKKHPQVFLPEIKEPGYFLSEPLPPRWEADLQCVGDAEAYDRLYEGAAGFKAVGDITPGYLRDKHTPARIHAACPDARIVIMLRDPVARAHSHYLMLLLKAIETDTSFIQALQRIKEKGNENWFASYLYIECGRYFAQVQRYLEVFGKEQVLVLLFDELAKNPAGLLTTVARHIGIDPAQFGAANVEKAHNAFRLPRSLTAHRIAHNPVVKAVRKRLLPSGVQQWLRSSRLLYGNRKPPLDQESRRFLQEIYDPDITRLEELLGRKMPQLRKSWI
jgi:hypothetical protein